MIRPSLRRFQQLLGSEGRFQGTHGSGADRTDTLIMEPGGIYNFTGGLIYIIVFSVHFVLAQIFHLDGPESTQSGMKCDLCKADAFNLQTLNKLPAEVQAGRG